MHTRELLVSGHGAPGVCRSAREDGGGQGQPGFLVRLWVGGLWDQGLRWDPRSGGQVWGDAGEFGVRRLVEKPVL